MKKVTLIMLVSILPFLTTAQKRSKKGKDNKIGIIEGKYEFMIIKGYEITPPTNENMTEELAGPGAGEMQAKLRMRSHMDSRIIVVFDFGSANTSDVEDYLPSQEYKSMSAAVNNAAKYGWEFVDANIISEGKLNIHYYYMQRRK
jgi:hypothetical protein